MKRKYLLSGVAVVCFLTIGLNLSAQKNEKWKLVWSDEFNTGTTPDETKWSYEEGFERNHELQWYQRDNAFIENGVLIIEGRKENKPNPNYQADARSWKRNREKIEYSASSINTRGKYEFQYGKLEVRAKIDTAMGLWPAIWTLGVKGEWPSNGEIDIMESYPVGGEHHILANVASGTDRRFVAKWDSQKIHLNHFLAKDPDWPAKFHIWMMEWNEKAIKLYLDGELLNETLLENAINPDGSEPFKQAHYILLNLAIGGDNGGDPSRTTFPNRYEIDYVRVYQQ